MKSIYLNLKKLNLSFILPTRPELDTSNIKSVKKFLINVKETDILVLNTGAPSKRFFSNY